VRGTWFAAHFSNPVSSFIHPIAMLPVCVASVLYRFCPAVGAE
jgi:hypothetical protein